MTDDLISRQAALDALMEILDRPNHAEFLYTDEICKALEDLPSAQPEIIRCKDCEYNPNPPECGNADCVLFYGMTDQMGFCHHGERREQE